MKMTVLITLLAISFPSSVLSDDDIEKEILQLQKRRDAAKATGIPLRGNLIKKKREDNTKEKNAKKKSLIVKLTEFFFPRSKTKIGESRKSKNDRPHPTEGEITIDNRDGTETKVEIKYDKKGNVVDRKVSTQRK